MKYYRPGTIQEALDLLSEGVPLAGGTALVPSRRKIDAVIALDDLGLDQVETSPRVVRVGASAKLQQLLDPTLDLPDDLRVACRLEAAWNLRNMGTIGGTIMSADARSPLLITLLALETQVQISGDPSTVPLDAVLDRRGAGEKPFLIEAIEFDRPDRLKYVYVARAPADRPLVTAAASTFGEGSLIHVAIGGFGDRPLRLDPVKPDEIEAAKRQAMERYLTAGDDFASAEYRAEIAAILVKRALLEVRG